MSLRSSERNNSVPARRIFMKIVIWVFSNICLEDSSSITSAALKVIPPIYLYRNNNRYKEHNSYLIGQIRSDKNTILISDKNKGYFALKTYVYDISLNSS